MRGSDACMYDPGIQYGRSPLVRQKKCHTYTQIQRLNSPKKFGRASKYVNHHAEVSPKFDLCAHCQKQKESVPANAPSATFFSLQSPYAACIWAQNFFLVHILQWGNIHNVFMWHSIHFSLGACVHYSKKCMELNSEIRWDFWFNSLPL
jgi:hypothetical protein